MGAATWDGYVCAHNDAEQDGSNFPSSAHGSFGQCGESGQCEAAGMGAGDDADACKQGLDMYNSEGPGGGHYDIMMGNYCHMAWGVCHNCSPYGTMLANNFYSCSSGSPAVSSNNSKHALSNAGRGTPPRDYVATMSP